MPQKITDLSDLISEPKLVRFRKGGKVYELPGDLPADLFLEIQQEADRQKEQADAGEEVDQTAAFALLSDRIVELFRQADPTVDRLPSEITLPQMLQLIVRLYGPAEDERPERPTKPAGSPGGTSSSSSKRRTRSRS